MNIKSKRQNDKEALRERFMNGQWSVPFKAPKSDNLSVNAKECEGTLVGKGTPVEKTTQVCNQTLVEKETQSLIQTKVENETAVGNTTMVDKGTLVGKATTVGNATQVGITTHVNSASAQDSSVALEARTSDSLQRGYTRIPNFILMRLVSGEITRAEMKIILLIARFTISFQRLFAPLSKSVIERQTGLRGPAVLEALAGLLEKNLIIKKQGDQHRPNMLGLVLDQEWILGFGIHDTLVSFETVVEKPTQVSNQTQVENATMVGNSTQVGIETRALVGKATPALVGNPTYYKDIKINKNKISLSELPLELQKYFSELKPLKKRESEMVAFEEILGDFSPADICACFEVVQSRGVNGDPCHSPMAYLSKAIGGLMAEVIEQRKKAQERQERETREADAARKQAETEERESAEWAAKEEAFLKAFPDQGARLAKIQELIRGRGFRPDSEIGMRMAIGKWAVLLEPIRDRLANVDKA